MATSSSSSSSWACAVIGEGLRPCGHPYRDPGGGARYALGSPSRHAWRPYPTFSPNVFSLTTGSMATQPPKMGDMFSRLGLQPRPDTCTGTPKGPGGAVLIPSLPAPGPTGGAYKEWRGSFSPAGHRLAWPTTPHQHRWPRRTWH